MKQLLQYTSRSLLDSFIASSKSPRYSRALFVRAQASTCPKCHFLIAQRRFYSQLDDKPASPKPSPGDIPPTSPQLESKPQSETKNEPIEQHEDPSLPSQEESRRSRASKRLNHIMDNLQGNIVLASQRLNDLTGYASIEHLKLSIEDLESQSLVSQELVRQARSNYKQTVAERASTQREVTTLLARKDTWSGNDLQRFTELYRSDHETERKVQEAAQELADREREAERVGVELQRQILKRYHEEQIWSDKIRRMSTWGTWGLMGVNVVLFLAVQFAFEPWRRRRLVNGFEEKVIEALSLEKERNSPVVQKDETIEAVEAVAPPPEINGLEAEVGNGTPEVVAAVESAIAVTMNELEEIEQKQTQTTEVSEEISEPNDSQPPAIEELPESESIPLEPKSHAQGLLDTLELSEIITQLRNPQSWRITAFTKDLFSDQTVSMRKLDLTLVVLEGAAVGATVVGVIVTMVFRRN